jgi:hypothetical protein
MAQAPRRPDGNDSFIRHIVTDPKNVPDVILLTGYLGASSEEAHERLYLSADLTNYVEIPNTAILHQAPLPKEQDAHGGVTLWVRKDAALQYKMAPAAQALANYFAGAIQAGAQGAPRGAGAAVGPRATIGVHCATFNCSLHCPTEITPCINTHANTCFCPVTHACPSQNQLCQSQGACTYVGCGASLACTQVLLCGGVAAAAVQAGPGATFGACGAAVAAVAATVRFCPTDITPCINSHGVTCNCPLTVGCRTQQQICVSQGCNSIGCDATAVCTIDLPNCQSAACHSFAAICGLAQQAAAAPQAAFAGQANLRPSFVDCSIVCPTRFGPCLSQHVTCAAICTQFTPCLPTRFQPQCPYPSEICTHVAGCQITNAVNCPVASGQACPQVSLDCPQQSLACGGFPGQPGFGGAAAFARNVGFTFQLNCSPPPWCHHTQWDICM